MKTCLRGNHSGALLLAWITEVYRQTQLILWPSLKYNFGIQIYICTSISLAADRTHYACVLEPKLNKMKLECANYSAHFHKTHGSSRTCKSHHPETLPCNQSLGEFFFSQNADPILQGIAGTLSLTRKKAKSTKYFPFLLTKKRPFFADCLVPQSIQ